MRIHPRKNIRWNGIVNWEKNAWNNNRFILEKIGCFYGLYYKRIKERRNKCIRYIVKGNYRI